MYTELLPSAYVPKITAHFIDISNDSRGIKDAKH